MTDKAKTPSHEKKPYEKPQLIRHGDLRELTRAEYGTLSEVLYGTVFSMSSPGFPSVPSR